MAAMQDAGLEPPEPVPADGVLHRFDAPDDKRGQRTGWAVLYPPDAHGAGGAFGSWRHGGSHTWSERDRQAMSREERRAWQERMAEARRQREAERQHRAEEAAAKAARLWDEAEPAPADHPYLTAKGVKAHGLKLHGDALVVPMRDASGTLRSLEFIAADGDKRFLSGGTKRGSYHAIGRPAARLYVAEGYATAASIHEATGAAVAVAFDAGNLEPVARALRDKLPAVELVVAADHDESGIGQAKARAAAEAVDGLVVIPPEPGDFNDYAATRGEDAVTEALQICAATRGTQWPEPQPLPSTRPGVEPFALALLPDAFRPWIADVAERMQAPADFPAVAAMTCLATVVGRQVAIRPNARDDWTVIPNLWSAGVGRPGVMKSPTLAEPMRFLERLEARAREEYEEAQKEHEAERLVAEANAKAAKQAVDKAAKEGNTEAARQHALAMQDGEPEAPTRRRYKTSDATVEALGELLNANPRGILLFRDELTGWLRGLDREGREADRAFFLEAWNGAGRYTYDRIGRGTVEIEATCVSLLGGIQPGPLSDYLRQVARGGGHDDGLLQRIQLAVWPDIAREWRHIDREPDKAAKDRAWRVFQSLDAINPEAIGAEVPEEGLPFLRFAADAQEAFVEWRTALEHRVRSGDEPAIMEAHLAKYRSLVPTLALLIHLADGGTGPVTLEATTRALGWAEYLETHARRIYAPAIQPANQAAHALAAKLRDGTLTEAFTARDVYRREWSGLGSSEAVQDALDALEDLGWVTSEEEHTRGRSRTWYRPNPRINEEASNG